ncbi:hypothetical protein [Streptomyces sp. NBC_00704]|uniref:hypothetical protein n=1 Tax=Streptomyces sp. NBC_00704 TaxID=2975809 RepID=UPI002E33FCFF|nr:hypothetical protein [Streptomyces sp. NBC_00704]
MNEPYEHRELEELMREMLAQDAYTIQPAPAPYPAIRRRGLAERRRRVAVTGAALAALAAVPVGAYAVNGGGGGRGADTAAPHPSVSATHDRTASPSPAPDGPARPATKGQLLDGITFEQAADGLKECLRAEGGHAGGARDLGRAKDYRIVLALRSTGDSNSPGDGFNVVAVKEKPAGFRVVCTLEDGVASGISVSSSDAGPPDAGPVLPDVNGGKLYQQSFIDKGHWKLPFRWGVIGTVEPSVAKVTVSYGDSRTTAVLDGEWFVAAGTLNRQVTLAPHIKGYDTAGKLVYDSDTDSTYQRTLP